MLIKKKRKNSLNKQNNIYFDENKNQILTPLNELEKKQTKPRDVVIKYFTNNEEEKEFNTNYYDRFNLK